MVSLSLVIVGCIALGALANLALPFALKFAELQRLTIPEARSEVHKTIVRAANRHVTYAQTVGYLAPAGVIVIALFLGAPVLRVMPLVAATLCLMPWLVVLWVLIRPMRYRKLAWQLLARRGVPICESCGYDLTAMAASARCPECGEPSGIRHDAQSNSA